jgi:hypothetical protein
MAKPRMAMMDSDTIGTSPQAALLLKEQLAKLPLKDQDFAASLLEQLERKGKLSEKQWFWVDTLAARISAGPAEPVTQEVGDFAGVIALFQKARRHLRYPRIWLQLADGRPLALALAGPNSSRAGWVNMTDGRPFGQNLFYGRVSPAGHWEMGQAIDEIVGDRVAELLHRLAAEPEQVAASYGKLTGCCCFCTSQLSDPKSTEVGYGPVCAKRWGLPWGTKGVAWGTK